MKKIFLVFFLAIYSLVFSQGITPTISIENQIPEDYKDSLQDSLSIQQERVIDFHSDIVISKKSVVKVTETIKVYATGEQIKRGLFRALPMLRNINDGVEEVDYKIISIKKDGVNENYHIEKMNGVFNIYIGSKDVLLRAGFYTYEISYETTDQIGHFKNYDEFYWNVNGTDWSFPIEHISANVVLPAGADILQNSCYTGRYGSQESNCTSEKVTKLEMNFKASNLKPEENLTIAVGFKPNVLEAPSAFSKFIKKNKDRIPLVLVACYLLFYYIRNWLRYGRNIEKPIVIPQFNAPYDLSPASIGYINAGKYDTSQLAANLVDLAVKKVISLKEDLSSQVEYSVNRVYNIVKLFEGPRSLQEDEELVFKKLFNDKTTSIKVDGTYNSQLRNADTSLSAFLEKNLVKFTIEISNIRLVYNALWIIVATFLLGLFYACLVDGSFEMLGIGSMLIFFDGLIVMLVLTLWKEFSKTFVVFALLAFLSLFSLPLFLFAFGNSGDMTRLGSDCFKFLIFGGVSLLIFKYFIKRPSADKILMKSEIDGFKMYLGAAEEAQLKFHNPPEMTTDLYEKFLPYAIALGVQEIWGKRFRDSLGASVLESSTFSSFAFDSNAASALSMSLSSSSTPIYTSSRSFSSSSSGSYSSSSSRSSSSSSYSGGSRSSGSSGRGSSGGGGGGGGGGGW
ncbi:DUF2207 domain-containing protein [Soonwooa sp.]|uniref:DUF2207 domain-containing protein n=1 Tax=Soonwooa sp. TaxID=1938592 RepID=UPI002602DDD4|nr:DUF2207 domain-containing protein [Soonwooa sp.]